MRGAGVVGFAIAVAACSGGGPAEPEADGTTGAGETSETSDSSSGETTDSGSSTGGPPLPCGAVPGEWTHAAVLDDYWIVIPGGGQSQGQAAARHVQGFVPNP